MQEYRPAVLVLVRFRRAAARVCAARAFPNSRRCLLVRLLFGRLFLLYAEGSERQGRRLPLDGPASSSGERGLCVQDETREVGRCDAGVKLSKVHAMQGDDETRIAVSNRGWGVEVERQEANKGTARDASERLQARTPPFILIIRIE